MKDISKEIELSSKDRLFEIIDVLKKNNILNGITPEKSKIILEELGPTFVKIGQILSNRPDIVPDEYIKELSKLRSDTKPLTFQEILDIVREEYDKNLFNIFLNIERTPLGSASIAQVHKAKLKNGEEVVIKVQRKNIKEKMITDIKLLKKACKMLHVEKITKEIVNIDEILDELLLTTLEEMNFITESQHIEEFYETNKEIKYIKIPKVYKKLTTEKVLVIEYISGTKIVDKEKLIELGYDNIEIGEKLADNYIYQAITQGYFHADPHPDNIIISDGKIAYIDFGMMGRLNKRNKELLEKCLLAIFTNNIREVEKILLLIGETKNEVNHSKLCKELEIIIDKNKYSNISDINITSFTSELMKILGEHQIRLPKDITMLVRGIVVLEGTLEVISPEINLMQVIENRVKNSSFKELFKKENIIEELTNTITSVNNIKKIPNDLHTFIEEAARGEAKFNIEVTDSSKKIDRFEKMVHRIVVCILDVAFIVGAALIVSNGVETKEQQFLFYLYILVGTIFTIWLFIKMYIDKLNRKK